MRVYIASPFFNPAQVAVVEAIRGHLIGEGFDVFSPMHDAGILRRDSTDEERRNVVDENVAALRDVDLVVCVTTGRDLGTIWEAGYACAIGKPVVYFAEGLVGPFNVMLSQTGVASFVDLVDLFGYLSDVARVGEAFRVDFGGSVE